MALAEVDRRLAAFERSPSTRGTLNTDGSAAYRSRFGPGDVDVVVVTFDDGRVSASQVLPD